MAPASKLALAALCVAALLAQSSEAVPANILNNPQSRRLAGIWVGSGSHNQGSSATVWAEGTTAQATDAAANGDIDPAVAARTGVITGEIATYEVQQDHNSGGHRVGKRRALLDLGSGRGSSATLWAQDTTAQAIDAAANGDSDPADAAQTGVITGEIATYEVQQGRQWVGKRRALLDLGSGRGSSATLWAQDTTAQAIDAAANGDSDPADAAQTGVITGEIATDEVQQGRQWVGKRRALLDLGSGRGSSATLWAQDTTAQAIDAAANGDSDPADAAQTGVITGEIATDEVQQGRQWVGKRRALLGLGSGRGSSATLWAQDTTAQSIDAAANGDSDPAVAAQTGVITGEIATYEVQQDIRNRNRRGHRVGGRRLAALA